MAFSIALRKPSTSFLAPKLFRSSHPLPATARSLWSSLYRSGDPNAARHRSVLNTHSFGLLNNPCLVKGFEYMAGLEEDFESVTARVDMPGVGKDGLKLLIKGDALHFEGRAEEVDPDVPDDSPPRVYSGVIDIPRGGYYSDRIKAKVKNGVLRIVIPKVKWEVETIETEPRGITQMIVRKGGSDSDSESGSGSDTPFDMPRVQFRDWCVLAGPLVRR